MVREAPDVMSSYETTEAQATTASCGSRHPVERGREVAPQVVDVLEPDTQAQQPVRDARSLPGGRVDEPMGEAGRVLDQRIRRAQADGGSDEPDGLHHGRGRFPPADDLEGEHGAGPTQLHAVGLGVEHPFDGGMIGEQSRQHARPLLRLPHPEGERGQAAVQQVGREWMEQCARQDPDLAQPGGPVHVTGDRTGHDVAVPPEELRRAVQRQRRAVPGGILEDRCGEGVVHEHGNPGRGGYDPLDVDLAEGRVLRSLEEDETRLGPDRGCDRFCFRPGDVDPEQPAREQMVGAAVQRPQPDHVAPLTARGQQACGQSRHPGRERDTVLGFLELGEPLLETPDRRVEEPRVDRASGLGLARRERVERADGLVEAGQRVGAREVDRRCVHAERTEVVAPCMNGNSVRLHALMVAVHSLTRNVLRIIFGIDAK